jgi:hypothetical protein
LKKKIAISNELKELKSLIVSIKNILSRKPIIIQKIGEFLVVNGEFKVVSPKTLKV